MDKEPKDTEKRESAKTGDGLIYSQVLQNMRKYHNRRIVHTFGTLHPYFAPKDRITCWSNIQGTGEKNGGRARAVQKSEWLVLSLGQVGLLSGRIGGVQ